MTRSAVLLCSLSAVGCIAGCRGILGIDEDAPLLPGAEAAEDAAVGDGGMGAEGGEAPDVTTPADGGEVPDATTPADGGDLVAVDRRFPVWPLPPPSPLLSNYDLTDDVVIDKTTGLMWQRGAPSPPSATGLAAAKVCEDLVVGGKNDWRLPTRIELLSILDYGQPHGLVNDTVFHDVPEPPSSMLAWTASLYLGNKKLDEHFTVNLSQGGVSVQSANTSFTYLIRCVRGGPTTMPSPRWVVGGETVEDRGARLEWQRASIANKQTFDAASIACASLPHPSGAAFRVPTLRELHALVDETREVAPLVSDGLSPGPSSRFWSSTPVVSWEAGFALDVTQGSAHQDPSETENSVRCVRSLP